MMEFACDLKGSLMVARWKTGYSTKQVGEQSYKRLVILT
jgi:hypothetical protein